MNSLTINQKKFLRAIAHNIKPMIIIGAQGVTDNLMAELESTLAHHEILKIKIAAGDREDRKQIIDYICQQTQAHLVQSIGKVVVIFKARKKDSQIELPRK